MERQVGGGIGMANTCKPMAVSFQCMTKFTTNKKKKQNIPFNHFKKKKKKKWANLDKVISWLVVSTVYIL